MSNQSSHWQDFAHPVRLEFGPGPAWELALKTIAVLQQQGHIAWLAGGCVRDRLLGRTPKDFDIATSATPEIVEGLFPKTVAVGKAFGVIRVLDQDQEVEVATFRSEGSYVDGRHPDRIEFTTPDQDASRRDFTINALFYDPIRQNLYDFFQGQLDLAARVIRAIGKAEDRFKEDHLRLLRTIRFAAVLDFKIEKETMEALRLCSVLVKSVSMERRRDELLKFFGAEKRQDWIREIVDSQLLPQALEGRSCEVQLWSRWQKNTKTRAAEEHPNASALCELALWLISSRQILDQSALRKFFQWFRISNELSQFAINALRPFVEPDFFGKDEFRVARLLDHSFQPGGGEGLENWLRLHSKSHDSEEFRAIQEWKRREISEKPRAWIRSADLPNFAGRELGQLLGWAWLAQLSGKFASKEDLLSALKKKLSLN